MDVGSYIPALDSHFIYLAKRLSGFRCKPLNLHIPSEGNLSLRLELLRTWCYWVSEDNFPCSLFFCSLQASCPVPLVPTSRVHPSDLWPRPIQHPAGGGYWLSHSPSLSGEGPMVPKAPRATSVAREGTTAWEVNGDVSHFPNPAGSRAPERGSFSPFLPLPHCLCFAGTEKQANPKFRSPPGPAWDLNKHKGRAPAWCHCPQPALPSGGWSQTELLHGQSGQCFIAEIMGGCAAWAIIPLPLLVIAVLVRKIAPNTE